MNRHEFRRLVQRRILRLDGATGTELVKLGMPPGVSPEKWVVEHPEAILHVQSAYKNAGSDVLYVPSFGGNPVKLAEFGLAAECRSINAALAKLSHRAFPGGIILGDLAPTGKLIEPCGDFAFESAVEAYKLQAQGLLDGGVGGFVIETMMDLQEARAALIAIRELTDELPVLVTLTFDPAGKTLTGTDPVAALVALQALGADAFGCNCSAGPEEMLPIIAALKPYADIPLIAKPNAGMPRIEGDATVFPLGPEEFAASCVKLVAAGASLVGGCCGTTPQHIAAMHQALGNTAPPGIGAALHSVVSSSTHFRRIASDEPVAIIGERLNPTGKKKLQEELRAGSLELVREFAREQNAAGAALLDVNVGLSGIDETATMRRLIGELTHCGTPILCIDSTRPEVVETALRLYPGRALLNSISAERARLHEVLPVAAKYGAMLVLLPLTDAGIPATLEERLEALRTIMVQTARFGYRPEDMVADALAMTVSTSPEAAELSLEFIRKCSDELHLGTICGLSNISFGMPNRPCLNSAFFGLAASCGLCAAIANPCAAGLMDQAAAADVLLGKKGAMGSYLKRFANSAGAKPASPSPQPEQSGDSRSRLFQAVLDGDTGTALGAVKAALEEGILPQELVNNSLIAALTEVGSRFERKEFYLPQLMQSANTMQKAMALLEPLLKRSDAGDSGPVFVLATVEGDIHDIGKNILALLLRNHNFRVVDLGKDVPAAKILAATREHHADLIGLSALMTTTMPKMREVIDLLRSNGISAPVFVGGAAVDAHFAESIGAIYGADAMETVRLAQERCCK